MSSICSNRFLPNTVSCQDIIYTHYHKRLSRLARSDSLPLSEKSCDSSSAHGFTGMETGCMTEIDIWTITLEKRCPCLRDTANKNASSTFRTRSPRFRARTYRREIKRHVKWCKICLTICSTRLLHNTKRQ